MRSYSRGKDLQSIYLHTMEHDLYEISATLYSLIMFVGMFIQFLIYVHHSNDLRRLIEDMIAWVKQRKFFYVACL